jgi:hypothetical protein
MRRSHPEVAADRYSTVKDFIYFDKGGSWVHQVATEPEAARISDAGSKWSRAARHALRPIDVIC